MYSSRELPIRFAARKGRDSHYKTLTHHCHECHVRCVRRLSQHPDQENDGRGSRVALWVIPTDEELLIARDTWRVVTGADVRY